MAGPPSPGDQCWIIRAFSNIAWSDEATLIQGGGGGEAKLFVRCSFIFCQTLSGRHGIISQVGHILPRYLASNFNILMWSSFTGYFLGRQPNSRAAHGELKFWILPCFKSTCFFCQWLFKCHFQAIFGPNWAQIGLKTTSNHRITAFSRLPDLKNRLPDRFLMVKIFAFFLARKPPFSGLLEAFSGPKMPYSRHFRPKVGTKWAEKLLKSPQNRVFQAPRPQKPSPRPIFRKSIFAFFIPTLPNVSPTLPNVLPNTAQCIAQHCPMYFPTLPNVFFRHCPMHFSLYKRFSRVYNKKGKYYNYFIPEKSIGQCENTLGSVAFSVGQCFRNTLGSVGKIHWAVWGENTLGSVEQITL